MRGRGIESRAAARTRSAERGSSVSNSRLNAYDPEPPFALTQSGNWHQRSGQPNVVKTRPGCEKARTLEFKKLLQLWTH